MSYGSRRWWMLGALAFSLFMIMLDNTVVNVALPTIQRDLGVTMSELEWTISAYMLTFAVLLLLGGNLADRVGRRRVFLAGLAIFAGSSLVCGLATSGGMLFGARAVQGIGSALMMPSTLSLIMVTFPRSERGRAIGIWAGVSVIGLAAGPIIGGVIVEQVSWKWIFYLNVPVGAVGIVLGRLLVPESRDETADQPLDVAGLVLSAAGMLGLTFALIEANRYGWTSPTIVGCFAAAAAGLALFVAYERRRRAPMLDLRLFASSTFSGANVVAFLVMLVMFGVFFFASVYLQVVLGYSAVQTGLAFLPLTCILVLAAPVAGKLSDRAGSRWPMCGGMGLLGVALLVLTPRLGAHTRFLELLPELVAAGFGIGLVMTPTTAAVLGAAPLHRSGVASGVLDTFRQTGGMLGVAIMGAVVAQALGAASPGSPAFGASFVTGFRHALLVAGALALAGALVAAVTIDPGERAPVPAVSAVPASVGGASRSIVGGLPAPTWVGPLVTDGAAGARSRRRAAALVLEGRHFPVEAQLLLGRGEADISLDDPLVSRRHALVRPLAGALELWDAGSANGTFVNGERIAESRRLADGDLVRLGDTVLRSEVPPAPELVLVGGPGAGVRFPVDDQLSIGRGGADISLDDPLVSRRHALVRPLAGALELWDAGSANGTFVNGERLAGPRRLADGDLVRVGDAVLRSELHRPGEAAAEPAAVAAVPGATLQGT